MTTSVNPDDDTAFYAELARNILLLTDEDDDEVQFNKIGGRRRFYNQRSVVGGAVGSSSLMPGNYFFSNWSEGGGEVEVPGWMERLWAANGGGTGVFIPRAGGVHRSRKRHNNKPRKNSESGKPRRQES